MTGSVRQKLLMMDESLFYQLLEGAGTVQIDIARVGQYFVPFVSFMADDEAPRVQYGAIVRNRKDLLAAETVADLLGLLDEMAGRFTSLKINLLDISEQEIVPH